MATIPTALQQRLAAVRKRIADAAQAAGRDPRAVRLLAVSKTFSADAVRAAASEGQRDFGENYVQEALEKITLLHALPGLCWHFIGPIQANKTRAIAGHFDWVHSIDRERVARRLSEQRPEGREPLQVCIEVNVSGEASKSGVAPAEARELARAVAALPRLRLRGLMAIPEPSPEPAVQRRHFAALRELLETLNRDGLQLDTLSMGMSADLESAVAEGATMVRVGTAIFGERAKA